MFKNGSSVRPPISSAFGQDGGDHPQIGHRVLLPYLLNDLRAVVFPIGAQVLKKALAKLAARPTGAALGVLPRTSPICICEIARVTN